eukprot:scaffold112007_cov39-Prasinocladus_malaysianus.AAC.2
MSKAYLVMHNFSTSALVRLRQANENTSKYASPAMHCSNKNLLAFLVLSFPEGQSSSQLLLVWLSPGCVVEAAWYKGPSNVVLLNKRACWQ